MSRIARKPLEIPSGVEFKRDGRTVTIKGKKGEFSYELHDAVELQIEGNVVYIKPKNQAHPMVGTTRKLLGNWVRGVHEGFERKLQLVGVGYRAKAQGSVLELSLGFSNPVLYSVPKGIAVETPAVTDIVIKGADLQQVGEVAAQIRAIRSPDAYKGKGARYDSEIVETKETKKK